MSIILIGPYTYIDSNIWLIDGPNPFVVDAGTGARVEDAILEIESCLGGRRPAGIIMTHAHQDHLGGTRAMAEHFGCPVYAGAKDAEAIRSADPDLTLSWRLGIDILPIPCESVTEGHRFDSGEGAFTVLETPGHTPGGICLYNQDTGELISGDTVFADGYGRTDLPGGDMSEMVNSLLRIDSLGISALYPGHGPKAKEGAMSVKRALIMVGR